MSVDDRGEHVDQVWLSDHDIDALVYVVDHALGCSGFTVISEMTRKRLSYLSFMLLREK